MSWLTKVLNSVWSSFKNIWKKVSPEIENTFNEFLAKFADVALKAVAEAALTSLTGSQKMDFVLKELRKKVSAAGWVAGETALRALIETVYAAFKATNGDNLVAPPNSSQVIVDKVGM